MKRILLIVFLFALVTSAQAQKPKRTIAVTFDDLPFIAMGEGDYLTRARAATAKILKTLNKHKVPAVAFVNEHMLEHATEREARIALLRDWVKNGMILGNHTYSHPDFNNLTVEQFQEEITKGEVVSRDDFALKAGEAVMALLAKNLRPRDICTREAFENAQFYACVIDRDRA